MMQQCCLRVNSAVMIRRSDTLHGVLAGTVRRSLLFVSWRQQFWLAVLRVSPWLVIVTAHLERRELGYACMESSLEPFPGSCCDRMQHPLPF